jgi:mRNA interferase HigB
MTITAGGSTWAARLEVIVIVDCWFRIGNLTDVTNRREFAAAGGKDPYRFRFIVAPDDRVLPEIAKIPFWDYAYRMRVIALRTMKRFLASDPEYADAREPTLAWYQQVRKADWATPADVRRDIGNASILKDGRAVFNVAGNKYRNVVWINYPYRVVYVRFIGTLRQYDRVDSQTI